MPIYGYGIMSAPWTIENELKKETLVKLRKIIRSAKSSFDHSNDQVFCSSIKDNVDMIEPYIASYDMSKTNMSVALYQSYMESLVQEANFILSKKNKFNNYKFDIMGNWQIGKIIIMKKK